MSVLSAGVCNCLIGGEGIDRSLADQWATGIRPNIGAFNVEIRQRREAFGPARNGLKDTTAYTTDIVISGLPSEGFRIGRDVVRDLCSLLTLATLSQVRPFRYDFDGNVSSQKMQGTTTFFRPPLETNNGSLVRQYLEEAWQPYQDLKAARYLPAVINYLALAELGSQPLEVKLLLMFTALENLKTTYSSGRGRLRKRLETMLKDEGIVADLEAVVGLRNEIVHEGLSPSDFETQWAVYARCHDLVHEYLFNLLKFSGECEPYSAYD